MHFNEIFSSDSLDKMNAVDIFSPDLYLYLCPNDQQIILTIDLFLTQASKRQKSMLGI